MAINSFTFWKDGKINGIFQLSQAQAKARFKDWLCSRTPEWLEHYFGMILIQTFITQDDNNGGLQAIGEAAELSDLFELLYPVMYQHVHGEAHTSMSTPTFAPVVAFRRPEIKIDPRQAHRRYVIQVHKPGDVWHWETFPFEPKVSHLKSESEAGQAITKRIDPEGTKYRLVEILN